MSTIPLSVLELLKCDLEPSALRRDFPAQPNNHGPSYIFVRQTANLPTGPTIGLRQAAALVREGVFANCAADWGDVVVISDQAHYALSELLTVFMPFAWSRRSPRTAGPRTWTDTLSNQLGDFPAP